MSEHVVVEVSPIQAAPRRIDGVVTEKSGLLTVAYTRPGSSKPKSESFDTESVSAYRVGAPGFVLVPSTGVISTFVGKLGEKNGKKALKTEEGVVYFNSLPTVNVSITNIEADSKEARAAERASRVKVRLPKALAAKEDSPRAAKAAKAAKAGRPAKVTAAPVEEKRGRGRPPATDKNKSARTEATPKRRRSAV